MSTGNTNLKHHIRNFHRELWHTNAKENGWKNLDSQVSTTVALQGRPQEEFDVEKFHKCLVCFIVVDNQVSLFCAPNCIIFSHCFIAPGHQCNRMPGVPGSPPTLAR